MKKKLIWTEAYSPFIMGGDVHQPIGAEVPVSEPVCIGEFSVVSVDVPGGLTAIAEATTGAIVGTSLTEVQRDIASGAPAVMADQVRKAAERLKKVRVLSAKEFFARWRQSE